MNKIAISAILFDLGDTLMIHKDPWTNVLVRASMKMHEYALELGIIEPKFNLAKVFLARLKDYYANREITLLEISTITLLQEILNKELSLEVSTSTVNALLATFYEQTRKNWFAAPDAVEVLRVLQDRGYTLGLVSNAGDRIDVETLTDELGFSEYLNFVLTSAEIGYRKPHPAIFKVAIDRLGFEPSRVAMVGDRLDADISGALNFGLSAVWLRRDLSEHPHADERNFHIARSLTDLLTYF